MLPASVHSTDVNTLRGLNFRTLCPKQQSEFNPSLIEGQIINEPTNNIAKHNAEILFVIFILCVFIS